MGCAPSAPAAKAPGLATASHAVEIVQRPKCMYCSACVDRSLTHRARFSHPGDPDFPARHACAYGDLCDKRRVEDHVEAFAHPGDPDYTGPPRCSSCSREGHGSTSRSTSLGSGTASADRGTSEASTASSGPRHACKFGLRCWRTSSEHTVLFSHPGDADYRRGRVLFTEGLEPEFGTLRQLFDFCDPDGHGNFTSKQDLQQALVLLARHCAATPLDVDRAWREMDGECNAHAGFAKFAAWVQEVGAPLPVGVELTPADSETNHLSCGFAFPDGKHCGCKHFAASSTAPAAGGPASQLCKCGHKRCVHALRSKDGDRVAPAAMAPVPSYWRTRRSSVPKGLGEEALVELAGDAKARFQFLFDVTHKATDNWTRDRGCNLHGLSCRPECAFKHKRAVPTGYRVEAVLRNMNADLWGLYAVNRAAIAQECEAAANGKPFCAITDVKTVDVLLEDAPLVESCNEWFLLHGTRPESCRSICKSGFSLSRAGTGATWKDPGASKGLPLYGYGLYFSESITKADEYSDAAPAGDPLAGCHAVLVCRVTGGRAQHCDTDKIDPAFLQRQVIAGPFHSVLGDRVSKLGKPYREMVVYDTTQCYPEYIVYYRRLYG